LPAHRDAYTRELLAAVQGHKERAPATRSQLIAKVFRSCSVNGTFTGFLSLVTARTAAKRKPAPHIVMK
jgi:hypothetical protein